MEVIGFTLVGIALYFISDRAVVAIEQQLGRTLQYRSLLFFAIIMVLALITFNLIALVSPETQAPHPSATIESQHKDAQQSLEIPIPD